MAGKRRLDVAKMVADAERGYVDDRSVARPPYARRSDAAHAAKSEGRPGGRHEQPAVIPCARRDSAG